MRIVDLDIDEPPQAIHPTREAQRDYGSARVIAWRRGKPLGHVDVPLVEGALSAEEVGRSVHSHFALLASSDADEPAAGVAANTHSGGLVSVVIATVSRPGSLRKAVRSVLDGTYEELELIVVDNSEMGESASIVKRIADEDSRVRYVHEPRLGSSVARNTGLQHARGEIVALTDDDVIASPQWVEHLVAAFRADPVTACVTGLILPTELETPAQLWFAEGTGFGKGYESTVFELGSDASALFPFQLGVYGSGANFALTRSALEAIDGFDPDLGGGTPARGGEDLDIFFRIIQHGLRLRYEPGAVVRHTDHRRVDDLFAQKHSYGIGLSAVLTKHFLAGQHTKMLRVAPRGIVYLFSRRSPKNVGKHDSYPGTLDLVELAGICRGPRAYLQSTRRRRRGC